MHWTQHRGTHYAERKHYNEDIYMYVHACMRFPTERSGDDLIAVRIIKSNGVHNISVPL